jgi:hypothetical protein
MRARSARNFGRAFTDELQGVSSRSSQPVAFALPPWGHTREGQAYCQEEEMDDHRTDESGGGLGDDQGTRVGLPAQAAPRQHSDTPSDRPERQTGAGSEATPEGRKREGSEPLTEDADQHRSGYGGAGGTPVTSSDEREEPRRR